MQLQIEELSAVETRVNIVVPAPQVDASFKSAYREIAKRVRIPGFRRGKVPASELRKRYGRDASADVTQKLVEDGWRQALETVSPVAQPAVDAKTARQGKSFSFSITVEVVPSFDIKEYSELAVERERFSASDAVIDHELEHIAEQVAPWEPVERTVAEDGDMVTIDFIGRVDGEAFEGGAAEDADLVLGSGQFIPGFEAQIVGKTVGDTFDVTVTFPDPYQATELAGKEAVFETTLKELKAKNVPEIGPELASLTAEEDLDSLKNTVRERVEAQFNGRADEVARQALRAQIESSYDFEVPPTLVEGALADRKNRLMSEAMQEGASLEDARAKAEEGEETLRAEVIASERASLVLDAIAETEDIQVPNKQLMEFIEQVSRSLGAQGMQYRQLFRDPDRRARLRQDLRRQNALDFLLTKANVTEIAKDVPAHDHSHDHDAHEHDDD